MTGPAYPDDFSEEPVYTSDDRGVARDVERAERVPHDRAAASANLHADLVATINDGGTPT